MITKCPFLRMMLKKARLAKEKSSLEKAENCIQSIGTTFQSSPLKRRKHTVLPPGHPLITKQVSPRECPAITSEIDAFCSNKVVQKLADKSYRIFKDIDRDSNNLPFTSDKKLIFCANDYLGMSANPKVKQAMINCVEKYGTGAGGTRNISGNSSLHTKLENSISDLHGKEASLVFSSCFVANDAVLSTLGLVPDLVYISDELNHASTT